MRKPHHTAVGSKEIGVLIVMDYEKELFAQCTPYLQWKLEAQDYAKVGNRMDFLPRKLELMVLGKHIYLLPFCSCMDRLADLLDATWIDLEGIYIFAGAAGRLAQNAIQELTAAFAAHPKAELVYADEDYFGTLEELYDISEEHFSKEVLLPFRDAETGLFCGKPWFKPDFSPDTLKSFFYIGNIFAVCGKALERVWKPQDSLYQMILRIAECYISGKQVESLEVQNKSTKNRTVEETRVLEKQAENLEWNVVVYRDITGDYPVNECIEKGRQGILHIPKVLYTNLNLVESEKLYGAGAFAGEGLDVLLQAPPLVSIIIPSKDHAEILGRCLSSLAEYTRYPNYEVIVVDNGSSDVEKERLEKLFEEFNKSCFQKEKQPLRFLYQKQPFNFSTMCNQGAQAAKGEYLLFLNDDIEVLCTDKWKDIQQENPYPKQESDWLTCMMQLAILEHAGAVGAKLYYPKAEHEKTFADCKTLNQGEALEAYKIQHIGIANMGIGPAHKLCGIADRGNLYHGVNLVNYNMLAVTAACLLIKKDKFVLVGGFDESLAVAYNDVELCFRFYQAGFYTILCNQAVLLHHESLSRGLDTTPEQQKRLSAEKELLYKKHPNRKGNDPFYSPNLVQWEKDVLYHTGYLYQCDKPVCPQLLSKKEVRLLPISHKNKYLRKLTGESRILYAIDSVESSDMQPEGEMRMIGWCAIAQTDNAKVERALLLRSVENKNVVYKLPIFPKLRKDVENLFVNETGNKRTQHTALAGIQVVFSQNALQKGCYEIGIYAKEQREYVVWSGRYLDAEGLY